jgi:hypothetical protein
MQQQPLVNVKDLKMGSVKLEVSDAGLVYVSLGTGNKGKFSEKIESIDQFSENGGYLRTIVTKQELELAFVMLEWNLTVLSQLRGGIDEYSTIAGTPVAGASQVIASGAWNYNIFIPIANQNGDGSTITINSVTGSVDGALTVSPDADADYTKLKSNGIWGIIIHDSTTLTTEAQTITINYDYTPAAAKVLESGGKYLISPKYLRFTNTDDAGKTFVIDVWKAVNKDGFNIEFPGDEEGKNWELPIKLVAFKDGTRTAGKQLYKITNNQI